MPQLPQLSVCPSCEEPLESGGNFCGACGADLSAATAPGRPGGGAQGRPVPPPPAPGPRLPDASTDGPGTGTAPGGQVPPLPAHPPAAASPSAAPPPAAPSAVSGTAAHTAVEWPEPGGREGAQETHRPEDLPGTDSGGSELPGRADGSAPPDKHTVTDHSVRAAREAEARQPAPASGHGGGEEPEDYTLAAPAPADPRAARAHTAGADNGSGGRSGDDGSSSSGDGSGGGPGKACVACRNGLIDKDGYCENCGHAQPRERDHMERGLEAVAAVSDRGLRHHRNEDAFALSRTALPDGTPAVVAVVCDGVSSATRPDEASAAAAAAARESLADALPAGTPAQQAMHEALLAAGGAVSALADGDGAAHPHGRQRHQNAPACTIVAAVVTGDVLTVGWIGDSRVYWVPDDRTSAPARLTEDDSWAAQMVAGGLLTEAEAYADARAHAITGWLGADAYELDPHTAAYRPDRPGVVVVCTDGLWNYAEAAAEMAVAVPADARSRPLHSARALVGYALDGGGHDNVTVAVLPFPGPRTGAVSA